VKYTWTPQQSYDEGFCDGVNSSVIVAIDYLNKLCWSSRDIGYFVKRLRKMKKSVIARTEGDV
jgi:hypothetical protein